MTQIQFLEAFVSLMLQVAAVVGVSGLLARRLRTAAVRDRVWSSCFLALPMLAACDFVLPHLRLISPSLPDPGSVGGAPEQSRMVSGLIAVWACGAALLALRLTRDLIRLIALYRSSVPAGESFMDEVREQVGGEPETDAFAVGGRRVGILFSEALRSPSCWQLHRPLIVLPASVRSFPPDEIDLIVRHELAHLRFRHPLLLFIQRVTEIVFWIHPAVWWASMQAGRTREFRCDDETVASRSTAAAYLRAILRLALPDEQGASTPAAAMGFGAECPLIVDRAERLASRDWTESSAPIASWPLLAPVLCAVVATILLWIPIGNAASRRSVWSPWPGWSASVLHSIGVSARDYEIDGHRLRPEELRRANSR